MIADIINVLEECIFMTLLIWGFENKAGKYLRPSLFVYIIFVTISLESIYLLPLPSATKYIVNVFIIAYIFVTYRNGLRNTLVVFFLSTASAILIQLILVLPIGFIQNGISYEKYAGLIVSTSCIAVSILLVRKGSLGMITKWVMTKRLDHILISVVWIGSLVYILLKYDYVGELSIVDTLVFLVFIITLVFLAVQWQKTTSEVHSARHELELQHLYSDTFRDLLEEIRAKQHDYMDQLNTILSMHHQIKDYSTLVEEQSRFSSHIMENVKYYELLQLPNCVLSGFLYSKFSTLDAKGTPVKYKILIENGAWEARLFEITETLAILLNNAAEAALKTSMPKIKVYIITDQSGEQLFISVKNTSPDISQRELQNWAKKGYTTKEEDSSSHGFGLYNAARISKRNGGKLEIRKERIEGLTWIEINVIIAV